MTNWLRTVLWTFRVLLCSFLVWTMSACSALKSHRSEMVTELKLTEPTLQECEETRAAWDIGSGSLKFHVARVDRCQGLLLEVLHADSEKTDLKEALKTSGDMSLPKVKVDEVSRLLASQQAKARELGSKRGFAVATAVFREAKNGREALEYISQRAGLRIRLVTQNEEGLLGYRAAVAKTRPATLPGLVWDIGGGSQQIVFQTGERGDVKVIESQLASVGFKDEVLKRLKRTGSPNPIGVKGGQAALQVARDHGKGLARRLPERLQNGLALGIGGVHGKSVAKRIGRSEWSQDDLREALAKWLNATDQDLRSEYASTEVTNLLLVLGMMQGLGIKSVRVVSADLTEGLLVNGETGLSE